MASSFLSFTPNPTINNSATFIADPCSLRQEQLPQLKQTNITSTNLSSSRTLHQSGTVDPTRIGGRTESMASRLATAWREIQGLNNWENLVEPLDPLLRQEIVRYGELVSACYKAFDLDPTSARYLNCKYGKKAMMGEVGLRDSGYDVTKYVYATAPDITIPGSTGENPNSAKWIGYVAASSDIAVSRLGRRDIVIAFRGTVTNPEWMANLMSSLTPARLNPHEPRPEVKVEAGFLSLYTSDESGSKFGLESCREQLLSEVSRLLNEHRGEEISITIAGHSMGSSLALLLAYDIAELGLNRPNSGSEKVNPVTVFSFGGPRVGNSSFKERCEELGIKVLRVVNVNDPITKLPGVFFNESFVKGYEFPWRCSCYAHVGVELMLDFFKMHNPSCVHDLENYIGLLKCPKSSNNHDHGGTKLMKKAKGFISGGVERFDAALRWRDAAIDVLNMIQSQWI